MAKKEDKKEELKQEKQNKDFKEEEDDSPVRDITKHWTKKAMEMKKVLDKQPKINFLIPLAPGEREGAYETVQINGYKFTIKKGVLVELPQQVVDILAEHYKVSIEAGKDKLIDRDKATLEALT